jgi:hypothetical protein
LTAVSSSSISATAAVAFSAALPIRACARSNDGGVPRVRERLESEDLGTAPLEGVERMHASAGFLHVSVAEWCVVTTTEPRGLPGPGTWRHAVKIQRVQVPSR